MTQELTRLSVNLNNDTADALREIMSRRGITGTEAVRRAISVYKYVEDQTDAGFAIQVVADDGEAKELVLL